MTILERLQTNGIRRLGTQARGFRYRRAEGRAVTKAERSRIEALKIPPAWTEVAISASESTAVQAVGKDAAGRWQYLYHARHVARRDGKKQARLLRFIAALPQMRRTVRRDLALPGIPRAKVLAGTLTILGTCFLRPGGEAYASENGSYGIATLQRRHVSVRGDVLSFDFKGKSAQRHQRQLRNRRLARLVRELLRHPGEVFKFRSEDGAITDLRTGHINAYIKEVMGEAFSAKDFRTWAANLITACALAKLVNGGPPRHRISKPQIAEVMREVAGHLGNTPAVCRTSYVFDSLIALGQRGVVIRYACDAPSSLTNGRLRALERSERALIALLRAAS